MDCGKRKDICIRQNDKVAGLTFILFMRTGLSTYKCLQCAFASIFLPLTRTVQIDLTEKKDYSYQAARLSLQGVCSGMVSEEVLDMFDKKE